MLLSRLGRARKTQLTDIGKGGPRDAWQVLANGGVATACAVAAGTLAIFANSRLLLATIAAFAGAYAAATADTWGTEIGTLGRGLPRSILTLRPIRTGLSGGVTMAGSLAEIAGALWLTAIATAVVPALAPGIAIFIGGVAGALVDSLLGATLQELRSCPACARACETNPHECGSPTTLIRGLRGFSNDLVNFAATLAGAAIAFVIALL